MPMMSKLDKEDFLEILKINKENKPEQIKAKIPK